jgi:AraC-like DNA-binding protein
VVSAVGYRSPVPDHPVHYGLPSPYLTVIFSLDDGVESASDRATLGAATPDPIVAAGLHPRTSYVRQRSGQCGIQLAVHPLACRSLFGLPAVELSVTDYDGRDVLGRAAAITQDRLTESRDWADAFRLVGSHLTGSLADRRRADVRSEVRHAWHLLQHSEGRMPISEVARTVGVTPRHLGTLFSAELGSSPKTVAQLFRFHRAVGEVHRALGRHGRVELAAVAARAGYADQAHLTRDFVQRLGVPPSRWIAEEFRNLQDHAFRAGADSMP